MGEIGDDRYADSTVVHCLKMQIFACIVALTHSSVADHHTCIRDPSTLLGASIRPHVGIPLFKKSLVPTVLLPPWCLVVVSMVR